MLQVYIACVARQAAVVHALHSLSHLPAAVFPASPRQCSSVSSSSEHWCEQECTTHTATFLLMQRPTTQRMCCCCCIANLGRSLRCRCCWVHLHV
jgi:hypothetical protein